MTRDFLTALTAILAAPLIGGLLVGVDRRITARLQNRVGPPLLQPFYDFFKLMGKERIVVNQTQMVYVLAHLLFCIASLVLLVLRQDLLVLIFILAFSTISLVMGAMSVRSPYSKIGAQRDQGRRVLQLVTEPVGAPRLVERRAAPDAAR